MNLLEAIKAALKASEAMHTLLGGAVGEDLPAWAGIAPPLQAAPYVVWHEIAGDPVNVHGAQCSLASTLIQFNSYATTRAGAARIRRAVLALFDQQDIGDEETTIEAVVSDTGRDGFDTTVELHVAQCDLLFWHNPAAAFAS